MEIRWATAMISAIRPLGQSLELFWIMSGMEILMQKLSWIKLMLLQKISEQQILKTVIQLLAPQLAVALPILIIVLLQQACSL